MEPHQVKLFTGDTASLVERDAIDFTTDAVQVYLVRGQFNVVRFVAPCVRDQRRTYSLSAERHHDYAGDPVGVLGAHYAVMVSPKDFEAGLVGPDVAICWDCYNDSGSDVHAEAVRLASEKWVPKPPLIEVGGREFKRTPPESFWEATRYAGDGYDTMDEAAKHEWLAVSSWGRDGWDFLEWPYYVAYVRNSPDGFEFATNCEGDVDWYVFPTQAERIEHMDRLAFWHWQIKDNPWVEGIHPDNIPAKFKGMFSWERNEAEKTDD